MTKIYGSGSGSDPSGSGSGSGSFYLFFFLDVQVHVNFCHVFMNKLKYFWATVHQIAMLINMNNNERPVADSGL